MIKKFLSLVIIFIIYSSYNSASAHVLHYKNLNELKKICVEPPPLYLGRMRGETSPKYIYDGIITNDTVDLDTQISIFIDNNPEYSVIPVGGFKYIIQKQ